MDDQRPSPPYMVGLRLDGRRALVVGGGPIAGDKIERLMACGAWVTMVAPQASEPLRALAAQGTIEWRMRPYRTSDLDGAFLVVAATDDAELHTRIHRDAEARHMLVNVVDVPALCNFIVPAVARRGPIAIAVSTSGASPALAKRLRTEIAQQFGEPYARLAEMLNEFRSWSRSVLPTYEDRRRFFEEIVNGTPDPIQLLRAGDEGKVRQMLDDARARAERASRA